MKAYYNEIEPYAAQWLRNLISEGLIANGDVDERSIEDVTPSDLTGYAQCHFFAGIGGWSLALRNAGWSDSRGVWTGSCPCQPFSTAGKGKGTADERHLWPSWFHLIRVCKPSVVFGEQVDTAINHGWLDLVQTDLEGEGYAFGAFGIPAGSVGAPHIRQRLWFVADSNRERRDWKYTLLREGQTHLFETSWCCQDGNLANSEMCGLEQLEQLEQRDRVQSSDRQGDGIGTSNVAWADTQWLSCRDGKSRPIESGTFPLAHGIPKGMGQGIPDVQRLVRNAGKNRAGRLKAYGNAIVPQVASEIIKAYMECRP